jgi:uncharacterized protein YkwD
MTRTLLKPFLPTLALLALAVPATTFADDAPASDPPVAQAAGCAFASASPHTAKIASVRRSTLCLINAERRRHGLRRLRGDRRLRRAAGRHARDMNRRNYFNHTSARGSSFVDRIRRTRYLTGARRWTVGENLAWGSGSHATARSIMRAWMNSSGHRANILNGRFREIGIGIARGAPVSGVSRAATYATSFGSRR